MNLSDFDYNLPKELIAQEPAKPRDHSRLLIMDKETGEIEHKKFFDIIDYLNPGDLLVLNNSKVFPARLFGQKKETGGKIEVFLLKPLNIINKNNSIWECLIGGRGAQVGLKINFGKNLIGEILKNNNDSTWRVSFNVANDKLMTIVEKIGHVPLPPYIKSDDKKNKKNYQTVYAEDKKLGSVAAPTAGLHFTKELIKKIKTKGIQIDFVTLHVGLGTFAPVKIDDITKHKMHSEWVEVKAKTIKNILETKKRGGRIIAVGTTTTRSLEAAFVNIRNYNLEIRNFSEFVNIFIYPPYKFQAVDAMITNFHLPKSTLLMLISAFVCGDKKPKKSIDKILKVYNEAIKKGYRFFSFGDAMFIK